MSELLFIVGYSNAGKDYIAEHRFANFKNEKLTEAFKTQYEIDHGLQPGDCNDKTMRNTAHKSGPMAGMTISDGMIAAYNQSLSRVGYGHKFAYLTLTSTIERLAKLAGNRAAVVITDLRKPTELKVLLAFAEVIKYNTRMIVVSSNKSTPKNSDKSLTENINLFTYLTGKPVEYCCNNRE